MNRIHKPSHAHTRTVCTGGSKSLQNLIPDFASSMVPTPSHPHTLTPSHPHTPADQKLPSLPSKRTLRNMDSLFVAARSRDLHHYLLSLLELPAIRSSQLLSSFLSNTSDPALFMPDTVGERAGGELTQHTHTHTLSLSLSCREDDKVCHCPRQKEGGITGHNLDYIIMMSFIYRRGCC